MKKCLFLAFTSCIATTTSVFAQQYTAFPGQPLCYPFPRSVLTGRAVAIAPYERLFPVRVYTTPPQQPLYNVPPYAVVAPY